MAWTESLDPTTTTNATNSKNRREKERKRKNKQEKRHMSVLGFKRFLNAPCLVHNSHSKEWDWVVLCIHAKKTMECVSIVKLLIFTSSSLKRFWINTFKYLFSLFSDLDVLELKDVIYAVYQKTSSIIKTAYIIHIKIILYG